MSEPLAKFFRGLTTQHAYAMWFLIGLTFWVAEIKPSIRAAEDSNQRLSHDVTRIADTFDTVRKEVAEIRADVKVHGVLIASMNDLKADIKDLRGDLSTTNNRITNWKEP